MAMDFLGAMFEGIGKTFESGAKVDVAKLQAEQDNKNRELNFMAIDSQNEIARINYLNADGSTEKAIVILVVVAVLLLSAFIIFRSTKK